VATIACFLFFFSQDQSRLWTSFYLQSLLILVNATAIAAGGRLSAANTLLTIRVIVAAVYFWAGVNKLNVHFFQKEFPWFFEPITSHLPFRLPFQTPIALGAALFEIAVGLGLLSRRYRKFALAGALLIHAMIFFCIGPLRDQWNNSSWIWGQTTAVQLLLLFWGAPPAPLRELAYLRSYRYAPIALATVLVVVAPLLNGFNRWDSALSFNVYSGNVDYAEIHMWPGGAEYLPDEIAEFVVEQDDRDVLNLQQWSLWEFNANPYPETRIFKALMKEICSYLPRGSACLLVREKASWFAPKSMAAYDFHGEKAPDLVDCFLGAAGR
jgi:uncharacterized membrane protein YphA (DoxX/SURF4 family)